MQRTSWRNGKFLALVVAGLFAAGVAQADKPSWAGEKPGKGEKHKDKDGPRGKAQQRDEVMHSPGRVYFEDRHRLVVREYYAERYRAGRCPPGLAKKKNGCLPPGQAKKWVVGRPLPREVVYYEVPSQVVVHLGVPPVGHRYVRVAADILLIAVGTGMVVDAIQDLGGM